MNSWKLAAILILAVFPVSVRADDPSTQPSDTSPPANFLPPERPDRFRGGFDGGYGRFNGGGFGQGYWRVTQPERDEVSAFMKEHSPERFKAINNLPEMNRQRLMMEAIRNYRNYQRVKNDQPELAQLMVARVELEDQAFKLVNQIKGEKSDDTQAQADKQLLQEKIKLLLDTNIKERQLRITRLQATLQSEQEQLAKDSKHRDELVERRLHAFLGAADLNTPDQTATTKPTTQP